MKVLDSDLIYLDVDLTTAEEIIQFAAEKLYEKGYVREGYAERVLEREKIYPTGLIGKGPGIAIPHTTADYAIRPAVCVIVPKQPVTFMMMGNSGEKVPAELVIPMVVKDSRAQVGMLKKMMRILTDTERLAKICKAKAKEEVVQLLAPLEED